MLIAGEDAEIDPSFTTAGSANVFTMWGSNLVIYNKRFNNLYALGLCHSTSKISPKEITSYNKKNYVWSVHCSIIHNIKELEIT